MLTMAVRVEVGSGQVGGVGGGGWGCSTSKHETRCEGVAQRLYKHTHTLTLHVSAEDRVDGTLAAPTDAAGEGGTMEPMGESPSATAPAVAAPNGTSGAETATGGGAGPRRADDRGVPDRPLTAPLGPPAPLPLPPLLEAEEAGPPAGDLTALTLGDAIARCKFGTGRFRFGRGFKRTRKLHNPLALLPPP